MLRKLWALPLLLVLGIAPVCLAPVQAHAQQDARRQAYEAGHQNGVNDRERNRPMNLKTGNWHGENLEAYEKGYQEGYRSNARGEYGASGYAANDARQQAYEAGYQNGTNDRERNKQMNLKTGNWHGENVEAYQKGYEDGYRNVREHRDVR